MKVTRIIRLVLKLAAITTFLLGGITLLFPAWVVEIAEGFSIDNYHLVRFIGTALIGFGITNWLYSDFDDIKATLPAIYGNLTSLFIAIIVDVAGLISGSLSKGAWLILGLHVIFAIAFGKCVFFIRRISPKA